MHKLKSMAKRGTALAGALSLLAGIGTSALPAVASADALNPLTERSLTLSSSSPGWSYYDGSGNSTYAPPHSGANGKKTGETFTYRMSSTGKTIHAITFQYCTTPAGDCTAPGNGTVAASNQANLNVTVASPHIIEKTDWDDVSNPTTTPSLTPAADDSQGNFVVLNAPANDPLSGGHPAYSYPNDGAGTPVYTEDWAMTATNSEPGATSPTGANNVIKITSATGIDSNAGDYYKIVFFGTDNNYITNPGAGSFFVRINTYDSASTLTDSHIIDGGVTVANVMNESITIQTKVLETMDFSVGTHDPDTYNDSLLGTTLGLGNHGQCRTLLMADPNGSGVTNNATYLAQPHNILKMGDNTAEYSLKTGLAYDQNSYWRLSSNSSGGATVYYTGHTLTNTVGDEILPMKDSTSGGTIAGTASNPGTEQFGLGIAHGNGTGTINGISVPETYPVDGDTYGASNSTAGSFWKYVTDQNDDTKSHLPRLYPLIPIGEYGKAAGTITNAGTAAFAFNNHADSNAIPIATESSEVVNCVTAKMRYIANIAATTPAGIYTTKINYVASPQY